MTDMFNREELADMPKREAVKPTVAERAAEATRRGSSIEKILDMVNPDSGLAMLMNTDSFAQMRQISEMYASSDMVPEQYRGKPANVMVAMNLAQRLGVDLFMLMQSTYIVHGKPGMEAKLVIALVNTRGPFTGPIQWRFERDEKGVVMSCDAYATHAKTGEECSFTVDWPMVVAEGWDKNKKWHSLRELMFRYRSASMLCSVVCPEVKMGLATTEELQDVATVDMPPPVLTPRFKTVGEAHVYASSIGMADEDFTSMRVSCDITEKEITHSPPKLDMLADKIDKWDEESTKGKPAVAGSAAPPREPKPGKVHVVDETKDAKARVDKKQIAELTMLGREGGKADTEPELLIMASEVAGAELAGLDQMTVEEYEELKTKLTS